MDANQGSRLTVRRAKQSRSEIRLLYKWQLTGSGGEGPGKPLEWDVTRLGCCREGDMFASVGLVLWPWIKHSRLVCREALLFLLLLLFARYDCVSCIATVSVLYTDSSLLAEPQLRCQPPSSMYWVRTSSRNRTMQGISAWQCRLVAVLNPAKDPSVHPTPSCPEPF